MKKYCLLNGKILDPYTEMDNHALEITGKRISDIIPMHEIKTLSGGEGYDEIIDVSGKTIIPGFIDIHNHGAKGVDYVQLTRDSIEESTLHHASGGTTSFLVTPGPLQVNESITNLKKLKQAIEKEYRGARVLGINMEGPYLNPGHGGQKEGSTCIPLPEEYKIIIQEAMPYLKIMTVAPELDGAKHLIEYLCQKGIITSIGHTEAAREYVDFAVKHGAKLITHIFNAMGQPVQQDAGVKPVGVEEYLMMQAGLMAEVMADRHGAHVDPVFLKILLAVKGKDNIILITDSVFNAGFKDGHHPCEDGRTYVSIEGDVNRLEKRGVLAGSVMTMNRAVYNMMKHTGIPLQDAVQMASLNPARLLRIDNMKGSIRTGMDADITVVDDDVTVYMTIVEGEIVYRNL